MISPLDAATSLSTLVVATSRDYGWTEATLDPGLAHSHIESPRGRFDAVCRLLTRGDRRVLLAEIRPVETGSLVGPVETPEDLFRRYLDVSFLERLALWGLARPAGADSLLCVTPDAARLLDTRREVAWADLAGADVESVHAILRRLETLPGVDSAALANEMRRWTDLNAGPLGRALRWGRGETERLLRQAILGLRRLAASPSLEPLGLTFVPPSGAEPGRLCWAPEPAIAWLDRLLAAAQEFAPVGAGGWSPLERRALERQLAGEDARIACETLRDSLLRLARVRISAPVQLRLLLPAEPERTAWRLALTQPLQVRDELPSADLYVFAPLRLDPRECGMGRVLEAYEKLARHAAREMRELARAGGRQLDLFAAEEGAGSAVFEASSAFEWVCRYALRITAPPESAVRDAIGYLVALHTLDVAPLEGTGGAELPAPLEALPQMFEG